MLANCQVIKFKIIQIKLRVFKTLSFFILMFTIPMAFAASAEASNGEALNSKASKYPQNLHTRSLAASCAACHGTNGNSASANTPSIASMDKATFVSRMLAFKSGERPATVMHRHAKGLTNQEIENLAEYFSQQPRQTVRVVPPQQLSRDYPN
jgi:cytochrome c553